MAIYNEKLDGNMETAPAIYIIKRSGKRVPFDKTKIVNAILGANSDEGMASKHVPDDVIMSIADACEKNAKTAGRDLSVEEIQDMVENALMDGGYHEIVRHYMTYRFKHEDKRKMTDIDKRIASVIDMDNEEVKQENSNKNPTILSVQRDYMAGEWSRHYVQEYMLPEDIAEANREGIIHFHDMDFASQKMHNCFTGGTKFVTSRGICEFKSFHDGDEVDVLGIDGKLHTAIVKNYGKKKMQVVKLKNGHRSKQVICTPDHRWYLADGSVTTSLKPGDKLAMLVDAVLPEIKTQHDAFMFALGFVIGDGADHDGASNVRLCGNKTKYVDFFIKAGFSKQNIKNSNDCVMYWPSSIKQDFINGKGWRFLSAHDQQILFYGYISADGAHTSNTITTADERLFEFIESTGPIAGYHISSYTDTVHNTNYKQNATLRIYHYVRHDIPQHSWAVSRITPYSHGEVPAWCVEEPSTHTFTLEGGIITGNCDLVNLEDMLQNGTSISGTHIDPPKSFATACTVASQIVAQVASSQYGGQTITLSHLAPFVDISRQKLRRRFKAELAGKLSDEEIYKLAEKELLKEVKSGCQTIQYQLITLQSTNGQAPFVTVFMYLDEVPEGQTRDDLALLIQIMLEQRILGVKDHSGHYITPAFPKLIYCLDEDNIHENSKYWYLTELAAKCTAKRMVPDYISAKLMKQLKGDVYPCMGCRSFLTPDRFTDKGVGNIANAGNYDPAKHKYYGRFNQGVVTINLVDVACSSDGDMEKFWKIFDERLDLCYRALMLRHNHLRGTSSDVAPILWQDGAIARLKPGETIDRLLYDGYSTISLGYAGLYECVYRMLGKSHTTEEGKAFGLKVMQHLNDACNKWKAETNIDFSVYGTPLESTAYKFAKCLQKRFGKIPEVTDHNYITNSYHINVRENIDAFSKLTEEAEFQKLSPGGAISYVEVPNMQNNIQAVLAIMKHIYNTILYAELNTKSDYCDVCGYDGEIQIVKDDTGKLIWKCPNCGNTDQSKMHVARRTCGYLGTQYWNQGRTEEIKERVLHM